jgi:MraZ protein
MWYGEFSHTLDEKSRFILPSKFRDKIKTLVDKRFYLTRGLEKCLFFFHESEWRKVEEKLQNVSFTKKDSRFFNRLLFSGAQEIEIDVQGRIIIPEYLKEFSGIKKEIIIMGVSDRIEIWDKENWKKFYQENSQKFEDISESLFE